MSQDRQDCSPVATIGGVAVKVLMTGIRGLTVTVTLAMTVSSTTLKATRVYVVVLVGEMVTAPGSGLSELLELTFVI